MKVIYYTVNITLHSQDDATFDEDNELQLKLNDRAYNLLKKVEKKFKNNAKDNYEATMEIEVIATEKKFEEIQVETKFEIKCLRLNSCSGFNKIKNIKVTDAELEMLEYIEKKSKEYSNTLCQPVLEVIREGDY